MLATIGEALIDFIYQKDGNSAVYKPVPGGSPYNTSIAMTRLGLPAAFLSPISGDMFGNTLMNHLETNGVNTKTVIKSDKPTTLAFARVEAGKAEYAFYSNGSADRNVTTSQLNSAISNTAEELSCLQVGSISLLLEPGASAIYDFIKQKSSTTVVSYDPNIRASLVKDRDWYVERIQNIMRLSTIIKISDEDLSWIFPDTSLTDGVEKILELGPEICVVTAGKEGAYWYSRNTQAFLEARDIEITDTIGAGDTFHAGLLAYLFWSDNLSIGKPGSLNKSQAITALQYASLAAEINCTREGADPPTKSEHAKQMLEIYSVDTDSMG